jgi:uncharacterized protein (DUF433 family)
MAQKRTTVVQERNGQPQEVGQYLVVRPSPSGNRLLFQGTRLAVKTVLGWLARGHSFDEILARWPQLKREALTEALDLAAAALEAPFVARYETVSKLWHDQRLEDIRQMEVMPVGKFVESHPGVRWGRLTFAGTRLPVETMLGYLAMEGSFEYILNGWPSLKRAALAEAVRLATWALVNRYETQSGVTHEPDPSGRAH